MVAPEPMAADPRPQRAPPSPWVAAQLARLRAPARVADVACGSGRHIPALLRAGHRVIAIDRDAEALAHLADAANVETHVLDLEVAAPVLPGAPYDAILVTRYLHRPLFPLLFAAMPPGGLLIYETFAQGHEQLGRPRRPEYLLRPGELRQACEAAGLTVLAERHGRVDEPRPAIVSSICAQAPELAAGRG